MNEEHHGSGCMKLLRIGEQLDAKTMENNVFVDELLFDRN